MRYNVFNKNISTVSALDNRAPSTLNVFPNLNCLLLHVLLSKRPKYITPLTLQLWSVLVLIISPLLPLLIYSQNSMGTRTPVIRGSQGWRLPQPPLGYMRSCISTICIPTCVADASKHDACRCTLCCAELPHGSIPDRYTHKLRSFR